MVCQTLRMALLVGAITAVAVSPARAHPTRGNGSCNDCGSSNPCGPTAPATRTITVTERVPEYYTVKRTAYKVECKTETYDTCRTECVPEVRERTCTVVKRVPVETWETRKVCKNVTVCEERTVMKTSHKYVQETCMKKQLVRLGHWECEEVCRKDLFGGLFNGNGGGLFGGHGCGHHGCNDACNTCSTGCNDACSTSCAPATRTRKHWVACPEYKECPVTVCKKVCVQEPTVCKVNVCKQVWSEEKVKVCSFRCVEEKRVEKYTVNVSRQVACKATRTVRVCVPYEVEEKACRMVCRTSTREVACAAPACSNDCGTTNCCDSGFGGRLRGLFANRGSCGCDSGCGHSHSHRDSGCCR